MVAVYEDRASSQDSHCSGFEQMLADGLEGKFNVIVAYQWYRLTRTPFAAARIGELVRHHGIRTGVGYRAVGQRPNGHHVRGGQHGERALEGAHQPGPLESCPAGEGALRRTALRLPDRRGRAARTGPQDLLCGEKNSPGVRRGPHGGGNRPGTERGGSSSPWPGWGVAGLPDPPNPAYASGVWYYGKTRRIVDGGRTRQVTRPREEWTPIPLTPLVRTELWERAQVEKGERMDRSQ